MVFLLRMRNVSDVDVSNRKVCIIDTGYDFYHSHLSSDPNVVTGWEISLREPYGSGMATDTEPTWLVPLPPLEIITKESLVSLVTDGLNCTL